MFEPGQIIRLLDGMVKKQDRIPADVLARVRGHQKTLGKKLREPHSKALGEGLFELTAW